jgi:hypothetical protein
MDWLGGLLIETCHCVKSIGNGFMPPLGGRQAFYGGFGESAARMHEGVSKCGAVLGDKAQGFGQSIFAHSALEVGERGHRGQPD